MEATKSTSVASAVCVCVRATFQFGMALNFFFFFPPIEHDSLVCLYADEGVDALLRPFNVRCFHGNDGKTASTPK